MTISRSLSIIQSQLGTFSFCPGSERKNTSDWKFVSASATRLASTIQSNQEHLSKKRRPSIKTTLPFHKPLSCQFSQNDFDSLERYTTQLQNGTILPAATSTQHLAVRRISIVRAKPPVLSIFIHARAGIRPRDAVASCIWVWRAGGQSWVWGSWRRWRVRRWVWGAAGCEWEDGRAGRVEDGLVGCVWDGGV